MIENVIKCKRYKGMKVSFLFLPLLLALFVASTASAGGFEVYKACFPKLSGWEMGEVEGMSMNYGGMNMVSANTQYTKGEKELEVSFTVGSFPGMTQANLQGSFEMNSSEGYVKMKTIRGKKVTLVYDREEGSSTVVIMLKEPRGEKDQENAMLNFIGMKMKPEEVLELAEKFDWKCFEKKINGK